VLLYTVITGIIAILDIAFSSPLFAVLGFEYSALMGLLLSLVCGIAVIYSGQEPGAGPSSSVVHALTVALLPWAVPLLISILSLILIPNCAFWDGLVFYLEVALPSSLFGSLFALGFRKLTNRRRVALWLFIGFWIVSLILSLLPGYYHPQLYTYGWQYGYFPGFVWDEALELSNAYWLARAEQVLWLLTLLAFAFSTGSKRLYSLIPLVLALLLAHFHDSVGITSSAKNIRRTLSAKIILAPNIQLDYKPGSISAEDSASLYRDVNWYIHDIRTRFLLHDTTSPIEIFVYPTTDDLYEAIGTRAASIAKPWLGEVHIAATNISSLKHELTHVLLREVGVWPFYASFSTGLTEGAAMSVESEYDGLYTLDEHAARILQLHYADGVKSVMAFTGFAANTSQKSYVLAGSFSRFLLHTYGPLPFEKVYRSLNFTNAYGKPLDRLEAEWKRSLTQYMTPLGSDDSLYFRYYYDRVSILFEPCIRRIGKFDRRGREAERRGEYQLAKNDYLNAIEAGGGITSLLGLSDVLYQQNSLRASYQVLDTAHTVNAIKDKPALLIRKGDLAFLLGDTTSAFANYRMAMQLKLSSRYFLSAYIHYTLGRSNVGQVFRKYLYEAYSHKKGGDKKQWQLDSLIIAMDSTRDSLFQYLYYRHHYLQFSMSETEYLLARDTGRATSFDRPGQVLRYLHLMTGEVNAVWDYQGFVEGLHYTPHPTGEDSLAFCVMCSNLERKYYPLSKSLTDSWCPSKYRQACSELRDEMDKQWDYTVRKGASTLP